jgi:hypothetical protein
MKEGNMQNLQKKRDVRVEEASVQIMRFYTPVEQTRHET